MAEKEIIEPYEGNRQPLFKVTVHKKVRTEEGFAAGKEIGELKLFQMPGPGSEIKLKGKKYKILSIQFNNKDSAAKKVIVE